MSGIASTGVGNEPKTYDHYLKMLHAFAGLYIWEYFTTLDFEWEVYTGRRPWRWSLIPYITTRTLSLISIIIALAEASVTTGINCEAWLRSVVVTAWLGASGASFLLLLRAVGIWGLDRRVVTIAVPFWLVALTAALYAMTRGRSQWSPLVQTCVLRGTEEYKWSLLMRLIVDCVLLGIMISGVLYKRNGTHLWNMLFIQGLFWISASILLEFPTVIMPFINTNDTWNVMFQYPLLISVVIASSRSYRDLFRHFSDDKRSPLRRSGSIPLRAPAVPRNGSDVQFAKVELDLGFFELSGSSPPRVEEA